MYSFTEMRKMQSFLENYINTPLNINRTKEEAQRRLQEIGILNKNNEITERYKNIIKRRQ